MYVGASRSLGYGRLRLALIFLPNTVLRPADKTKPMDRQSLIMYIKENVSFYRFVNFDGHSDKELIAIKKAIDEGTHNRMDKNEKKSGRL